MGKKKTKSFQRKLTTQEMCEKLHDTVLFIKKLEKEENLSLLKPENLDFIKEEITVEDLEQLVRKGFKQSEIAKTLGISKPKVRQLLQDFDLHSLWRINNLIIKSDEKKKSELIFVILYGASIKEEHNAYQKALEYKYLICNKKRSTLDLDQIEKLFNLCYSGKKYKSSTLEKITGISQPIIVKILRAFPETPIPYNLKAKNYLTKEQKAHIKRAKDSIFGKVDIAYFLNISKNHLSSFKKTVKKFYKCASQIYEAQDLGFNIEEIAELTDNKELTVYDYIKLRPEIEPAIIEGLETIFQRKFEKPYL